MSGNPHRPRPTRRHRFGSSPALRISRHEAVVPAEPFPASGDPDAGAAAQLIALPPALAGETVRLLVMTGHGTYLADAEILHAAPAGHGWRLSAEIGPAHDSTTVRLVPATDLAEPGRRSTPLTDSDTPDQPINDCVIRTATGPAPTRCLGCLADRHEPCRWRHPEHRRDR